MVLIKTAIGKLLKMNKLITKAFYLTGDIEKYGTGFKRLREWFSEYPELKFNVADLTDSILVKVEPVQTQNDNGGINGGINKDLTNLLQLIKNNPGLRTKQLSRHLNNAERTVEKWISTLKNKQLIIFKGSKKTGGYYIKDQNVILE